MEGTGIGLGDAMLLAQRNNGACGDMNAMWNNPFFLHHILRFIC
jgi:hypothetical protein